MTSNVAVIMSVYKTDCLEKFKISVNSILSQDYLSDLYLYRDGPVSEGIDDFLDEISCHENVRLYRSDVNKGLAHALNYIIDKVVENGGYEYIARMDSDDISYVNRISTQVSFLEKNIDVDVCGTSCKEVGASYAVEEKHLPPNHEELLNFSMTRCPFVHPTVMFRAKIFEAGVRYPVNTTLTEDMALWFCLLKIGYKFSNINEVLLEYYLDENTIYRRKGIKKAWSEVSIRMKNMVQLNKTSLLNVTLILSRFCFHLAPAWMIKLAYKYAR
ncbi:glycosyltransferase [Photobacterium sp. SP02]|uniref:glycosyltransferase n=1 Tax=Photobacterium sp. SP02 TaxID=3032280 RepID=UPI0031453676